MRALPKEFPGDKVAAREKLTTKIYASSVPEHPEDSI
jgi:hypothetical protein